MAQHPKVVPSYWRTTTTVACWGNNRNGQLRQHHDQSQPPVAVSGLEWRPQHHRRSYHTCATKNDGTVACWGENNNGQLGDGPPQSGGPRRRRCGAEGVTAVSGGSVHNWAQKSNGHRCLLGSQRPRSAR
ncbi:MAG: hypothetical protein IPH38_18240 [Candidatus Microthrix sp.]|nr:hypothetical protein [Candidatus Microthrix sp.]